MTWDCGDCVTKKYNIERNCGNHHSNKGFKHVTKNGLSFKECPKSWLNRENEARQLIEDYVFLKEHGVMQYAGGLLEQDSVYIEACSIIGSEVSKLKNASEQRQIEALNGRK